MKCPFCQEMQNSVVDSRLSKEGTVIRRRRHCENTTCHKRFTTYERVEELLPMVVKKDGRREIFDRLKVLAGLKRACEKRPISAAVIDKLVSEIEQYIQELGEVEIASQVIGETMMKKLRQVDPVAYVRFASVYRSFQDVGEFVNEIQELTQNQGTKG